MTNDVTKNPHENLTEFFYKIYPKSLSPEADLEKLKMHQKYLGIYIAPQSKNLYTF